MVLTAMEKDSRPKKSPAPLPPKQMSTKISPVPSINWEFNEKISLSSGSSTGIEMRPDKKIGIGFMDKSRKPLSNHRPLKSSAKSLDLLNVSGYPRKSPAPKVQVFQDTEDTINVLRSDSKYEIGIPGECTISRKKRQERRKIESIKYPRNTGDLTGTVRRRWVPANEKIDDSIAKRLELIHELNQKILANYERIQSKSKKLNTKSPTKSDSLKSSRRSSSSRSRPALSDLRYKETNKEHIYTEISSKTKSKPPRVPDNHQLIEKVMVHRVADDLDPKSKPKSNPKDSKLGSIKMKSMKKLNLNPKSRAPFVDENFIMAAKSEIESPQLKGSLKPKMNRPEALETNSTNLDVAEIEMKDVENRENIERVFDKNLLSSSKLYPDSKMNMRSWKDELYTSLRQDQSMERRMKTSELNGGNDVKEDETSGLEKEILDNLNETIGRFDNEKNVIGDENVDEGTGDDTFSDDSIQCTTPTTKVNGKDTSNQETFNSSWDSGVGIDVGSGSGWVRIHTGIESSLVYLTIDTTTKDICRDMLLGDELSLYIQVI